MSAGRCPSAETLATFAEGLLTREELQPVIAHLDGCPRCRSAVAGANQQLGSARWSPWWLAAAAAVMVVFAAIPLSRSMRSPVSRLVRLVPASARIVESRLSGGFAYAPYEGPMRATDAATDTKRLKLGGAAGEIVEKADRDHSPRAEHAAGIALVLIDRPLDAATRLRALADRTPSAQVWSDLAAARYAAAVRLGRPSLYPEALDAADRALRIDPQFAEALFNRALILDHLGLPQQAREAWERYLRADPSSQWANEARAHLARLKPGTTENEFRRDQPRLERSALAGDQAAVDELVKRYPQQARTFAEAEYLGRWAAGDADSLVIATRIGDALARSTGESLLIEAVQAIDRHSTLASAHVAYRRGRIAFSRREPAAAEKDLRAAAAMFAGTPMSLVARYYAASARYDQNDVTTARRELESLLAEADGHPQFIALGAQVRWELALCLMINEDFSGASPLLEQAAAAFRRLDERTNLAVMETMLADAMTFLGRPDDAWSARIRALQILSEEGRGTRLPLSIGEAARVELLAGRVEPARALLAIEESAVRDVKDDVLLADTLAREAVLHTHLGDAKAAAESVREAFAAAKRIPDAALRERAMADAHFAEGAVSNAERSLTIAIDHYRATGKSVFLPEALLLRSRARNGALDDLDAGIAEVERHRTGLTGTGVFDAASSLFEDAIRLRLDRGDVAGAFSYAERWRGNVSGSVLAPVTIDELQRRLAGTDAAVLELVVLRDEVAAFCITTNDATSARHPIEAARLAKLIDEGNERALYDLLIRANERTLSGARRVTIVAGSPLDEVPFAALHDGRQHLVERFPIGLAPSASALRIDPRSPSPHSIVAIRLPSGEAEGSPALSASELDDIVGLYGERNEIPASRATFAALQDAAAHADVIHIAGHTERQPGAGDDALMFAGTPVSWRSIAAHPLSRAEVVVLAACETLRAPRSPQTRAMSLGGGFLAAGARDVIGTLTPLADEQARSIFTAVHRNLARGQDASESLRNAQLEALAAETAGRRRTAWRAVALLTTRIPRAGK